MQQPRTLTEYAAMAARRRCNGPCGGKQLPLRVQIDHASNPFGWLVEGFEERQWLTAHCEECGYGNSFWKLGIAGSLQPALPMVSASRPESSVVRVLQPVATSLARLLRKGARPQIKRSLVHGNA